VHLFYPGGKPTGADKSAAPTDDVLELPSSVGLSLSSASCENQPLSEKSFGFFEEPFVQRTIVIAD
jgi:hypothetical protein